MTPEQQYQMLVESLQLLAAPAEEQLAALPDYVCITDEVVSNFGDAYLLVPQMIRAGMISDEAQKALKNLDGLLDEMPDDDSLVDADSLKEHVFWKQSRLLAELALVALGEQKSAPNLKNITYIK